jgi:hypothetical protein
VLTFASGRRYTLRGVPERLYRELITANSRDKSRNAAP